MILGADLGTVRNGQSKLSIPAFVRFLRILRMDIWRFARRFGLTRSLDGFFAQNFRVGWSCGEVNWGLVCDTFPAFADDLVPQFSIAWH